jgi:hypothetical protein
MIATSTLAEQRTVLHNISWQTFEALLKETAFYEHENPKIQFDRFIIVLAEELEIEIKSAGSTTLKRG